MVTNQDTPEEQLLKIIEGPKSGGSASSEGQAKVATRPSPWGALRQLFASLGAKKKTAPQLDLDLINRLVALGVVLLLVYITIDLVMIQKGKGRFDPSIFKETPSKESSTTEGIPLLEEPATPLEEYLKPFTQRNPFTGEGGNPRVEQEKEKPTVSAREKLEGMVTPYVVVGIQKGTIPIAMIEDTVRKRTYFVREGEKVGELHVNGITETGVLFGYEGEEIEIH